MPFLYSNANQSDRPRVRASDETRALIAKIKKDQQVDNSRKKNSDKKQNISGDNIASDYPDLNFVENELTNIFSDKKLNKGKISVNSKSSDTSSVLDTISKSSGLDFIIDDGVKGRLGKLSLKNCTPGKALEFVCQHSNPRLAIIKDKGAYRVMLKGEAEKFLEEASGLNKIAFEPIKVTYASFSESFKKSCESAWTQITGNSGPSRSYLYFDQDRKKILVRGSLRETLEFKQFLSTLDKPIMQVRIDAIILFAKKSYEYEFGINWSGIYNRSATLTAKNKSFGFAGLGADLDNFTPGTSSKVSPTNFAVNLFNKVFTRQQTGSKGETFLSLPFVFGGSDLNTRRLNLVLNAAEEQSKVKIISRPSILTSTNQQAIIYIGQQLPMQSTTVDNSGDSPTRTTVVKYQPIGITLKVTPTVSSDKKSISLAIDLEETEIASGSTLANDQGIMTNPPIINIISVKNSVILRNGETTVIGGLTKNDDTKSKNRLPFLHKIPVLGKVFKSDFVNNVETEQFVFITPTIVELAV